MMMLGPRPHLVPLNSGTNDQPVTTKVSSMLSMISSTVAPWSSWAGPEVPLFWLWLEWSTFA